MIVSTVVAGTNQYGGDFDEENIPDGKQPVPVRYTFTYYMPIWTGEAWIEGLTEGEIFEYNAMTEVINIQARAQEATNQVDLFFAKQRIRLLTNVYTEQSYNQSMVLLKPFKVSVSIGNLKEALIELEQVEQDLINLGMQTAYNNAHSIISNVIPSFYPDYGYTEIIQNANNRISKLD